MGAGIETSSAVAGGAVRFTVSFPDKILGWRKPVEIQGVWEFEASSPVELAILIAGEARKHLTEFQEPQVSFQPDMSAGQVWTGVSPVGRFLLKQG